MNKVCLLTIWIITYAHLNVAWSADPNSCANYNTGNDRCYYNADAAVTFALDRVLEPDSVYFSDYTEGYGGNCTNFASQVLLAGLTGKTTSKEIWKAREKYTVDLEKGCVFCWYFIKDNNKSPAILGNAFIIADELYKYAKGNKDSDFGMHFNFITKDGPSTSLEVSKVKKGDIIFADWKGDGIIDHSMIVTGKTNAQNYYSILVSYQNAEGYDIWKDRTLGSMNEPDIVWHVYRPTFYTDYVNTYPFRDIVKNSWYYPFLKKAWNYSPIKQETSSVLKLEDFVTRSEFIQLAVSASGKKCEGKCSDPPFLDINESHEAYQAIKIAYHFGWIIYDKDHKKFHPNNQINRAEAVKILLFASGNNNYEPKSSYSYDDVNDRDWFFKYVNIAAEKEIVMGYPIGTECKASCTTKCDITKGKPCFCPGQPINRAETYKLIANALL